MLEFLKDFAAEKLKEKILSSSLGEAATAAAADEGSSELVTGIVSQLQSGGLSSIMSLFSNDGNATEENNVFQDLVGKISKVLQSKGMSADEADMEANSIAPDIVEGLKEKFSSKAKEDSVFDIDNLGTVLEDSSSLFDQAKKLL